MVAGFRPYSIAVSPKGTVAVLSNQGGGQGDTDLLSVIDLKQNPPRIVDTIAVEQIPEGRGPCPPDGNYVAAIMQKRLEQAVVASETITKAAALSIFRNQRNQTDARGEGRIRRLGTGRGLEQGRQDAACPVDG